MNTVSTAAVARSDDGRTAGSAGDLRGAVDVPGLAVPDRHQRLPGPARQAPPGARDRRRGAVAAALPGPAARRAARGRRGRAGDRRRRAGDDRAGVPGRSPASGFEGMKGLRAVLTSVNRQPAVAFYLWRKREGAYLPLTIDVLRVTGGAITEIITFHDDQFPRLGLPERLPADDTE